MKFRVSNSRVLAGIALSGFMLAVAGCQSGDSGAARMAGDAPPPPNEKILESELRAYCPVVTLREGTSFFRTYEGKAQDDPRKLIHQASIADVTRNCTRADGMLTMNVALAGRVVSGPAGKPGTITMPIRVAVVEGDKVLYSQLHKHQVQVGAGATQFVFNDPNVTIPDPAEQNVRVFVGYDEGPPAGQ